MITPEKAIEELSKIENRTDIICYSELKEAAKLGIEALKAIKEFRSALDEEPLFKLPGETED